MTLEQLVLAASELSEAERELLAHRILDTLDEKRRAELDTIWYDQAEKRLKAMQDGSLALIDGDEAFAQARRVLHESQFV